MIVDLIWWLLFSIISILGFYYAIKNFVEVDDKTIRIYLVQFYYIFTSYFSMAISFTVIFEIIKRIGV